MIAVTHPGRQAFYRDYANEIRTITDKFKRRLGKLDCYGADKLNRARYFQYTEAVGRRLQAMASITPPLHLGDRYYIGSEYMVFERFCPIAFNGIDSMPDPIVMLFPRHRNDERDWGEDKWKILCDRLLEGGYCVAIAGLKKQSCLAKTKGDRVVNIIAEGERNHSTLDMTIAYLDRAVMAIGSQSFLPLLSMHQGVPTLMWGREQYRHQEELNYFNTPCRFINDPDYQSSVDEVWDKFKEFEDGLK